MKTDAARRYASPDELLRALVAESRDAAGDVVAAVIARAEADSLGARLRAALDDTTATIADLEAGAEEAAQAARAAAVAQREAAARVIMLEPLAQALEDGRLPEAQRERADAEEARTTAERTRAEAESAAANARDRLAQARRDAAAITAKLAALATVPQADAAALAPLAAALLPVAKR